MDWKEILLLFVVFIVLSIVLYPVVFHETPPEPMEGQWQMLSVLMATNGNGLFIAPCCNKLRKGEEITDLMIKEVTYGSYTKAVQPLLKTIRESEIRFCCAESDHWQCEGYAFSSEEFECSANMLVVRKEIQGTLKGVCSSEEGCWIGFRKLRM